MQEKASLPKVAMYITRGCLVVPIQVELYDKALIQVQEDALEKIKETGTKGMIIDVSAVEVIDSFLSKTLFNTARMAFMLGAATVFTGFKPGVAASLVDLDIELGDIQTAVTLEEGFQRLKSIVESELAQEEIEEPEEETGEKEMAETEEETEEATDEDDEVIEDAENDKELEEKEPEDEA